MNEATRHSLNQELVAIDEKIAALNEEIRHVCWRQSPNGDRRQSSEQNFERSADNRMGEPEVASQDGQAVVLALPQTEHERRLPSSQRVMVLRRELALALQRYLTLHALLEKKHSGQN